MEAKGADYGFVVRVVEVTEWHQQRCDTMDEHLQSCMAALKGQWKRILRGWKLATWRRCLAGVVQRLMAPRVGLRVSLCDSATPSP